jgi:hypothetical protein
MPIHIHTHNHTPTHIDTSTVHGALTIGNTLRGQQSNAVGTVSSIARKPAYNLKNSNIIQSNTDFGFILNLYENY